MKLGALPDGSFPLPSNDEIEKAWTRAICPSFPQSMTTDDYQGMNILPGNRIGWEHRQEHVNRLSDLYTLGYLTEEEYEKRVEWVNNAQTVEQVNIVFSDLRRNILSAEAGSYLETTRVVKESESWWASAIVFITTGIMIAMFLQLAAMQAWFAELILIGVAVVTTTALSCISRRK